jgi:hypothetical protein
VYRDSDLGARKDGLAMFRRCGATFFRSLIEVQLDRFTIYWDRVNLRANQQTYVPGFLIPKFGSTFGVRWEFSN